MFPEENLKAKPSLLKKLMQRSISSMEIKRKLFDNKSTVSIKLSADKLKYLIS